MKYKLIGNTYQIKEELKSNACLWNNEKKYWETPNITKDELTYKMLYSLCSACDVEMIPFKLSNDCQKIQDILTNF